MKRVLYYICYVAKCLKLELLILTIMVFASLFSAFSIFDLNKIISIGNLTKYFSDDRLNMAANISMIVLGVYGTITSVFGASRSMATSRLAQKDLTKEFIIIISSAMSSALILSVYIMFAPDLKYIYFIWLIGIMLWAFVGLVKFLVLVLLMYYYNIRTSLEVEQDETEKFEQLMNVLTEMNIELKNKASRRG